MASCSMCHDAYLHTSYLTSTWSPGLNRGLAELVVQPSVLEQNAGRKEEMGQAGSCEITLRLDQSRQF